MKYKPKEGIIHIQVCGEHLLVSTRSLWPNVKMFRHIPKSTAICWDMLSKGVDDKKIAAFLTVLSRHSRDDIQEKLDDLLEKLIDQGYLFIEDSDDEYGYYEMK